MHIVHGYTCIKLSANLNQKCLTPPVQKFHSSTKVPLPFCTIDAQILQVLFLSVEYTNSNQKIDQSFFLSCFEVPSNTSRLPRLVWLRKERISSIVTIRCIKQPLVKLSSCIRQQPNVAKFATTNWIIKQPLVEINSSNELLIIPTTSGC